MNRQISHALRGAGLLASLLLAACGSDAVTPDAHPADGPNPDAPLAPASLTISPLTTDYGSVVVGQSSSATAFTVTNTGASTSAQINVSIDGQASDFHVSANDCHALAPAATCKVSIVFAPTAAGARSGMLHAAVSGSTASAVLTGTGGLPGNLAVSPSSFAFATAVLGTPSTETDMITVKNTGTQTSGSLTVQATGSDPSQFTKVTDTCSGQALAANATCTITAHFTPTTTGAKSAGFTILGNPGGSTTSAFTGTAAAQAQLVGTPTSQDFGTVAQGSTSSNATVTVLNAGGSPTGTLSSTITGANAAQFTIATSTCTGTLAPLASCTLVLRYAPSAAGAQSATLTVTGTPGGTITTTLAGKGATPGGLTINPTTQAFSNTLVGQSSGATQFTVTNSGGTAVSPLGAQISGGNAADFKLAATGNTCNGATLAPAATCTVGVVFAPASSGAKVGSLDITGGGGISAPLSGNALPAPQLALSPTSKDFGSVGIGSQSASQTFTLSNVGGASTTIPTISLAGSNPDQFVQTNNCTTALAPTQSCAISVRFQPTTSALDVANLVATSSTGGSVSSSLFGQGQQPAQIAVLPSSLSFTGTVGDTSPTQTFIVRNDGTVTTGMINIAITAGGTGGGQFSQTSTCTTLAAGATCTVSVVFAPTSSGTQSATATVTATPGGTATVALSGVSHPRLEVVTVNNVAPTDPYNFGAQFVGSTTNTTIKLQNNTSTGVTVTTTPQFPAPAQFAVNGSCTFLAAGASCTIPASFSPTSVGTKTGSVAFTIGTGVNNQAIVNFTGVGATAITITANTSSDFGNVVVGQTSPTQVFTVTNQSSSTVGSITSNLSTPFAIVSTSCGATLAAGASCTMSANFKPTTIGPAQGTLVATANPGGVASIGVTGTGTSATDLVLNPAPTAFGNVFAGTTKDIAVVVTNPAGAQTSGPMQFTYTGDPAFTILNNNSVGDCVNNSTALPNGQTCNIRIRFAPVAFDQSGTHLNTGTLTVKATPGTPGAGVVASITGTSQSTLSITPADKNFGLVPLSSSQTQTFVVKNDSASAVTLANTLLGGTSTGMSITANTCTAGSTLFANATCSVTVTFAPTTGVNDAATLTVNANNAFGSAVATIEGTTARFCATNCKFLVIYADGIPPANFVNGLKALPSVGTVDVFDGRSATPSLALMLMYDEVVAISDNTWQNANAVGDNLASYSANHPVVAFGFNFDTRSSWGLTSAAWTAVSPFVGNIGTQFSFANLGTFTAGAQVMSGVTTLTAYYRNTPTLASGATLVASWTDNLLLIAVKGSVVGVNAYVGDSAGNWSGDFAKVAANATF